jgi:hypothetical protein
MNPLKWVRWKIVIGVAVVVGGLYFLGLNPLARHQINKVGSSGQAGARFSIEKAALGLAEGRTSFNGFQLATPRQAPKDQEARERVAQADELVFDLGMDDFLRKRFAVDELSIKKPLLHIERRADGTVNVSDIGQSEPEKPAGQPTDWVKAVEEWMEKIKKRVDERRKKEAEKGKPPVAQGKKETGIQADYSRRITYPFDRKPRALVRKISAEALEIQFDDQTGNLKPPPLRDGKVEILNLSDRPEYSAQPIQISVSGKILGGSIAITGTIDLRETAGAAKNDLLLRVEAKDMPLKEVVQAFARGSLGASFEKGTADLDADLRLSDLENISIRPHAPGQPLFAIKDVQMTSQPGAKIAGLDARQFCQVVNDVGHLEAELEIGGTLSKPEFNWGKSLQEFILSGGKAFAKKEAEKGLEKGQKLLEKELQKNPNLQKALPGVDLKAPLKDGAAGALDSLFGKKKPAPKPAEKPAADPKSP